MKKPKSMPSVLNPAQPQEKPPAPQAVEPPPLRDGTPYCEANMNKPAVNADTHHYEGRVATFIESALNGGERVLGCVRGILSVPFREKCKTAVEASWPDLRKSAFRRQYELMKPLKHEPAGTKLHREQVLMFHDMMETAACAE